VSGGLSFDPGVNYYQALGVSEKASADEIKRAFRKLAKKYHPDSTGGDKAKEAKFKEINSAYDVLGDAKKRAEYDAFRAGPRMPPGFTGAGPGAEGFGYGGGVDLGDLFAQVFRGGAPGAAGSAPGGVRYEFYSGGAPDLDEMFGGQTRPRRGRRHARRAAPTPVADEEILRASDGSRLVRRGADLHSDVRVQLDQAILGAVVDVPTASGRASVKVPPGTSSGAKLRLRGKGVRGLDGHVGDHYVTVHIDVPKHLDEAGQRLLVEFMQHLRKKKTR